MRPTKSNSKAATSESTKLAHAKIAPEPVAAVEATAVAVVAPVVAVATAAAVVAPVAAVATVAAAVETVTAVAVVVATAAIAGNFGYQAIPKSLDSKVRGFF